MRGVTGAPAPARQPEPAPDTGADPGSWGAAFAPGRLAGLPAPPVPAPSGEGNASQDAGRAGDHRELGAWLRQQRENRLLTRPEMARQLIAAARAAGENSVPSVSGLARSIYRWECGIGPAPARYQLYYRQVLDIPGAPFGTLDTLRWCWGDVYDISHDGGKWQAARKDGTGRALAPPPRTA